MRAQHTPTPWRHGHLVILEAQAGRLVADTGLGDSTDPECHANAVFIVRACNAHDDMLEALEMVRDADNDCRLDGSPMMPSAARAKIDAAIAKAKDAT